MGYLNNTSITVDAILTKKGRELLAQGRNAFQITQFALADDEVDYDLWNPAHPLGKNYYGVAIENMPVTEAVPDETQVMKYKLVTLEKGTLYLPVVSAGITTLTLSPTSPSSDVNVSTTLRDANGVAQASTLNTTYTATILDSTYVAFGNGVQMTNGRLMNQVATSISATVSADSDGSGIISLQRLSNPTSANKTTKLIVTGNQTGGRVVIDLTISPNT